MIESLAVHVVDDDPSVRDWAQIMCEDLGLACRTFTGGDTFLEALDEIEPGCILLDMRMPKVNGLAVQAELAARGNPLPVIGMSGYGDVDVAVQSMRLGAFEFIEKPFSRDVLTEALKTGFQKLGHSLGD